MTPPVGEAEAPATARSSRSVNLESLVVLALAVVGLAIGVRPILDNSTFTHLRTGIDMVRHWSVPRRDPYSFTAYHTPWVVESWFASLLYGLADELGGLHLVVFFQGLVTAAVTVLVTRLARTGSFARTAGAAIIAMWIGAVIWAPRPLMLGLLCFALLVTAVESRWHPAVLVPIVWLWVNTHGSFPLGLAWLVLRWLGGRADAERHPSSGPYIPWFVGGLVVSMLNPLGYRLLTFAVVVGRKRDAFSQITEWRSPNFQTSYGVVLLVALACGLLALFRRRLPWADALPAVAFLAAGLLYLRNIAPAAIVMAPVLGRAMAVEHGSSGDSTGPSPLENSMLPGLARLLLVALAVLLSVATFSRKAIDDDPYPVDAVAWMTTNGLLDPSLHRVAMQAHTGNYVELVRGTAARVFLDDRADMFPASLTLDYEKLLHGSPQSQAILDHYAVDTVLWDGSLPLVGILRLGGGWRTVYTTDASSPQRPQPHWVVMVRDPAVAPRTERV